MSLSLGFAAKNFEVRFASLFHPGRALSFPCDERGQVDLASMPDNARQNYLSVHQKIGREYATPQIREAIPMVPGQSWN